MDTTFTDKRRQIFINYEDFFNWDKQIEYLEYDDALSDLLKEKSRKAFIILKFIFGTDYFKKIELYDTFLSSALMNFVPWTREWIVWLAENLHYLKAQENYDSLIARIKKRNSHEEGLSVLEAASKLHKNNFKIDFDPQVIANKQNKTPDLIVSCPDTNENFYVEVSILGKGEKLTNNSKITDAFVYQFPYLHFAGRLFCNLSDSILKELLPELEEKAKIALSENRFQEINHKGVIELGFSSFSSGETLLFQKWAKEKNIPIGSIFLPNDNFNPVNRLRRKIQTKQRQLPENLPNVLVIKMSEYLSSYLNKEYFINEIEKSVHQYNHILAVVIYDQHIGSFDETVFSNGTSFFKSKLINDAEVDVENVFFIFNKCTDVKVTDLLIEKILNSFF